MTLPPEEGARGPAEGLAWKRSSRSGSQGTECVELAHTRDMVRDSKNPEGPRLAFGPGAVDALIEFVKHDR